MERAKMKSLTDGAEVTAVLFVHALNASGQPCVQLWIASCGASVVVLCSHEGVANRAVEPHGTQKVSGALKDLGFNVTESGKVEVSFSEVGQLKSSQIFRMPASRLIGGRPFKTGKSPVQGSPAVKKVKEWRCVAGEEPFLLVFSAEVASVLKDQDRHGEGVASKLVVADDHLFFGNGELSYLIRSGFVCLLPNPKIVWRLDAH